MSAKAFFGAHPLSLEEVASVAVGHATVIVEDAAAAKVKAPSAPLPALAPSAPGVGLLTPVQYRAAALGVLNQSLQGRTGLRPETAGALLERLNAGADLGAGAAAATGAAALATLAASSTGAPTPADIFAVTGLTGAAAGVAALAMWGAAACVGLADGVAAVTVEALRAPAGAYDAETQEMVRVVAGQASSAAALRLLLDGSQQAGKATAGGAGKKGEAPYAEAAAATAAATCDALVFAASLHGSTSAPLAAAAKAVLAELNATPAQKEVKGGEGRAGLHAAPLLAALLSALSAVATLSAASRARADALRSVDAAAAAAFPAQPSPAAPAPSPVPVDAAGTGSAALEAAARLQTAVDALLSDLAVEFGLSSEALLGPREVEAAAAAAIKAKAKAASAAARLVAEAEKVAAMSPEERAKWDAEQARKAGKAAKREGRAEKAEAAGTEEGEKGANPLGLGPGSAEFRSHVRALAAAATPGGAVEGAPLSLPSLAAALSPYLSTAGMAALSSDGTMLPSASAHLRRLLERLASGGSGRQPKVAKGARDYHPEQMEVREAAFSTIRAVFKRHGAVEIDTPVFELRDTLLGKYGEEGGKLIYDLADQGGELLSLRYDLTVPFARYLALHGIDAMKRFAIAKVYRRDNPQIAKGRYREFYQCDYDVAGVHASMMPDAEVLKVAVDILSSLPIGDFVIKLNHRLLLDAMLEIAGVPASKFRPICSAIDKLDKEPWAAVRAEMVDDKGLDGAAADAIGRMVQLRGEPNAILAALTAEGSFFAGHAGAATALGELRTLFAYLTSLGGALSHLLFDLSLARGLDYYTGVIYEAVLTDPTVGVGSIAAGGRYDNLVGMFAAPGTPPIPCVGVSIGVERVFAIMEARAAAAAAAGLKRKPVSVFVASIPAERPGHDMALARMSVAAELWAAGFTAEMMYADNPKLAKQMTACLEAGTPYIVILAEDELDKGLVGVKDLAGREQVAVPRAELVATLRRMGARTWPPSWA